LLMIRKMITFYTRNHTPRELAEEFEIFTCHNREKNSCHVEAKRYSHITLSSFFSFRPLSVPLDVEVPQIHKLDHTFLDLLRYYFASTRQMT